MVGDASEFGPASRDTYAGILFWPAIFKKFPVLAMETGFARLHPPPSSLQVSNSAGDPCICPANSGLFEFVLVSASVSADKKGGSRPSVSASKNSVADSDFRDWFDEWMVGHQFEPNYLHHPVFRNRTPRVILAFVPRIAGFLEFTPVSASVSARQ